MGVEVSSENFRKNNLNRFPAQEKIINAFSLLKDANIKRTAYNIIGLPNETEDMILDTIKFNSILDPDNITVAFYSPYLVTVIFAARMLPMSLLGIVIGTISERVSPILVIKNILKM